MALRPDALAYLAGLFPDLGPVAVLDVGANPIEGDAPYKGLMAAGLAHVTGFEPQEGPLAALNARKSLAETYHPHALGAGGPADLHLYHHSGFTSLFKIDPAVAGMVGFAKSTRPAGKVAVETRRLDDLAEIGRAEALESAGNTEAALEALRNLSRSHAGVMQVHVALGDMLRRAEKFDEAITAYTAALDLVAAPQEQHWVLFYTRGIAHERQKQWDQAEADFRKALALSPDQAQVLNYLGYGFIDMNRNLDEALAMIERAVELAPNTGYILDSLAWGYYRLGRYADALAPMEKASLMEPVDPIVTDHLGDVYWAVGRKLEARFQWRRALSFDPEEKEADRIRRKLEVGLDAVLAEEGAAPLKPVDAAANAD